MRPWRKLRSVFGPSLSTPCYNRKNLQVVGLTAVSFAWCRGEPLEGGKKIATKSTKRHEKNGVLPFCAFSCFLWPPSIAVNGAFCRSVSAVCSSCRPAFQQRLDVQARSHMKQSGRES